MRLVVLPDQLIRQRYGKEYNIQGHAAFERFAALHRQAVWDEILTPVREAKGDPHWRPTGMIEGLGYQAQVSKKFFGNGSGCCNRTKRKDRYRLLLRHQIGAASFSCYPSIISLNDLRYTDEFGPTIKREKSVFQYSNSQPTCLRFVPILGYSAFQLPSKNQGT